MTSVWNHNLECEMSALDSCLHSYPVISVDTEFPGFLTSTDRNAPEEHRYEAMRFNVDALKLIQLGLTLSDDQGIVGGTWEINFCDFDQSMDLCRSSSIEFLKNNGVDFQRIRNEGVSIDSFAPLFVDVLSAHPNIKWVTFHGMYDLAYVFKLLTKKPMPGCAKEFERSVRKVFGFVYDVKVMAGYCHGLEGLELGLERLAKILEVERLGGAHQAGSDSLLTSLVFSKLKKKFHIQEAPFQGQLYGLSSTRVPTRVVRRMPRPRVVLVQPPVPYGCPRYCYPVIVYPPVLILSSPVVPSGRKW